MSRAIFLDSGPLGLLTQRIGAWQADACRAWLDSMLSAGVDVFIPEIVDYELRRELLRAGKTASIARLDSSYIAMPACHIPLTTAAMRLASRLWAEVRQRGLPTADPKELDVDVILAAQIISMGLPPADIVVATSNPGHISRFVPADLWANI
jgi:predicted nucleic acid-binding protein